MNENRRDLTRRFLSKVFLYPYKLRLISKDFNMLSCLSQLPLPIYIVHIFTVINKADIILNSFFIFPLFFNTKHQLLHHNNLGQHPIL